MLHARSVTTLVLVSVAGALLGGCSVTEAVPVSAATVAFVAVCQDARTGTVLTDGYCLGGHPGAAWRYYDDSLYRAADPGAFTAGQKPDGGLSTLPTPDATTTVEVQWGRHALTIERHPATS
ncbi:hypothetical protein KIH74_21935 [Kineosporia sp. J2-2]|uniref:Lipoprotein n=1 Tax=Kineosporia corallincola TaxID=2835133 RepID=A0ABS5TKI8_9ACTN|nr:hypothetical protein [Kineosporia corallincola]MBT0771615.1 hypothetical protein [Kineosporia corallincola]